MKNSLREEFVTKEEFQTTTEEIKEKLIDPERITHIEEEIEDIWKKLKSLEGQLGNVLQSVALIEDISNAINEISEKVDE